MGILPGMGILQARNRAFCRNRACCDVRGHVVEILWKNGVHVVETWEGMLQEAEMGYYFCAF
jgi:hypothetical protein